MWYTATSASISNGSTIVQILAGDDIGIVQGDGGLIFESESPVQVKRGYTDGSGNNYIELQSPWPYLDKLEQPLVVYPTDASFAEATAELRRVIDTLEVASTTDMQAATNDVKISTPLKVKQAIDFHTYNKTAADAEFVSRSDILGTVSQSDGVPTGAIIESGSNVNGEFWRYQGGMQVCTHTINLPYSSLITTIGGFGLNAVWTYPVSFDGGVPKVSPTSLQPLSTVSPAGGEWHRLTFLRANPTAMSANVVQWFEGVPQDGSIDVQLIAIGKWY